MGKIYETGLAKDTTVTLWEKERNGLKTRAVESD